MKILEFSDGIKRDQAKVSLEEVHGSLFLMVTNHYCEVTVVDLSDVSNAMPLTKKISQWHTKRVRKHLLSVLNPQWEELKKKENK